MGLLDRRRFLLALGASTPVVAPSALFANGEAGAWLEPSPTTYDAATGDIDDLSGNDNHATQGTAAARMALIGTGPYYLEPDGDDDNFEIPLGAAFTGDFCLILDTGPIFGSIDTGANATWNYTVNPIYIPDGNIHALIVVDRAITDAEKAGLAAYYADAVTTRPSTANTAFRDRTDLTALDTSYGDWTQVTNAFAAFLNCSNLTTPPDVSGWTGVTIAQAAFAECSGLITPPDVSGWTQVTNAWIAFRNCSGLTTPPDVSGWTQVTNANGTFLGCSALTAPPDVSGWTQVTNAPLTFAECSSLEAPIDISNWNPTILINASFLMRNVSAAGFDQAAYDSALIAWDAAYDLTTVNTITINFGSAQYGAGAPATARNTLAANGWSITDGGPA
jgi:hypothetical protein